MASEQDAIAQEIARQREEVAADVGLLEERVQRRYEAATDWRRIASDHPMAVAGAVLGAAFILGLRMGRR